MPAFNLFCLISISKEFIPKPTVFSIACLGGECLGAYGEVQLYSLVLLCFQYLVLTCQMEFLAGTGRTLQLS